PPNRETPIQRQDREDEEEIAQPKPEASTTTNVGPGIESRIHALQGGGEPLPPAERAFFEPRFGYDFSQVRIHAGPEAAQSARALNAHAYTVGRDVVFAAGEYAPGSDPGRRLIAHELTHVVQQGMGEYMSFAPFDHSDAGAGPVAGKLESDATVPSLQRSSGGGAQATVPAQAVGVSVSAVEYAKAGSGANATSKQITADEKKILDDLITKLQTQDPALYQSLKGWNIVVAKASLSGSEFGEAVMTKESEDRGSIGWQSYDLAGGNYPQGIEPSDAAKIKAYEQLMQQTPQAVSTQENRYRFNPSVPFVVLIDLDRIYQANTATNKPTSGAMNASTMGQGDSGYYATVDYYEIFKHELGHLLFGFSTMFDVKGILSPLMGKALDPALAAQLASGGEGNITDEYGLLSEIAAHAMEETAMGTALMPPKQFLEEFDPKFGTSGYHDVTGNGVSPVDFGLKVVPGGIGKGEYSLIEAKSLATALEGATGGAYPIYLKAIAKVEGPTEEERVFSVFIGQMTEADTKASAEVIKQSLKNDQVLKKFRVVPEHY
ncbi:MAG: DUF4157 domain-containing protein, partial [Candidatus Methanoperedens sp.]|nr:DUF4157 domain-containing protein [Candidatus Methanoperedens sp.]